MTTSLVDARFAGGHITVATTTRDFPNRIALVIVDFPSYTGELFAHEARNLAAALVKAAETAEQFERETRPVSDLAAQHDREGIPHPVSGDDLARLREAVA